MIVSTIVVFTTHLDALAFFYEEGLGWDSPAFSDEKHKGYQLDNIYFGFDLIENRRVPGNTVTTWFRVKDVEKTYNKLIELGGNSAMEPVAKPWGAKLAAVYDIEGNLIGLEEEDLSPN